MSRWPLSYPLSLLVAAAVLAPLGVLVYLGAGAAAPLGGRSLEILGETAALTGLSAAGAVMLGVPLAFATTYGDLPLRRVWVAALAAPLAIPSYIGAFAFFAAFGAGGEIDTLTGLPTPSVQGLPGAAVVMALYTYPFVLLSTRAALRSLDGDMVDAARTLGLTQLQALVHVVLPRARSGIAAGALLVALYTLSDFGTPAIMGVDTFTRIIYVEYNAFGLDRAALLSLQLLALVALVLYMESRVGVERERPGRPPQLKLGAAARAAFFALAVPVVAAATLLPVGVFTAWLVRDGVVGFEWSHVFASAYASGLAAGVAVLVALPIAFAASAGRFGRMCERVTYLGFGIPGIVLGTALVYVGLQLSALYQTLTLLVLAYVLRFLPLAVGAERASNERVSDDLVGAARTLGASRFEAFRRVSLPLVLPGIVAGAALVFLEAMRELPATLLLRPTGFETLATYLWRVYETGHFGRGAVPGLALVLVSGLALVFMLSGEARHSRVSNA